jgi:hypothetical protein
MDESNGFTQYGLVPAGPINLSKRLGSLSLSVLGDLTNRVLQGDATYENNFGAIGITKTIGSPTNVRGTYYTPEGELSASGTLDGVNNVNYSTGPYSMGTDTKGNYYGSYQGDGFQVNATDKSLDTSFEIPMVDPSNSMSAGAGYDSYSKTPEVYGQFHKQLSDNGFVDASGRLTPKGYELMLQGGFSF